MLNKNAKLLSEMLYYGYESETPLLDELWTKVGTFGYIEARYKLSGKLIYKGFVLSKRKIRKVIENICGRQEGFYWANFLVYPELYKEIRDLYRMVSNKNCPDVAFRRKALKKVIEHINIILGCTLNNLSNKETFLMRDVLTKAKKGTPRDKLIASVKALYDYEVKNLDYNL